MRSTINSSFSSTEFCNIAEGKLCYFEGSGQFVTQYNKVTVTVSPLSSVYRKWTGANMRCEALELAIT